MSLPGQTRHPELVELTDRVRRACLERKLHWGTMVASARETSAVLQEKASWIVAASEMDVLAGFWGEVSEAVKGTACEEV